MPCIIYYYLLKLFLGNFIAGIIPLISEVNGFQLPEIDEPLILTSFVESGLLQQGRDAASVPPFADKVQSYSGFFTVDKTYDSNLFFWYFPAEEDPETAPVVLWLQGGPGISSLFGLFVENGVYKVVNSGDYVKKRSVYWSKTMHLLYLDNSIGTGFSFTNSTFGYAKDDVYIGKILYSALVQFFTLFPNLKSHGFYTAGESYAGKYATAICYRIHVSNPTAKVKINLKGLTIGNGFVDPVNQLDYGTYLLNIGLIDEKQKKKYDVVEKRIKTAIIGRQWKVAYRSFMDLILQDLILDNGTNSLFYSTTGYAYYYNYLTPHYSSRNHSILYNNFLNKSEVKRSLHAGDRPFLSLNLNKSFDRNFDDDYMRSVAAWLSALLNSYKVLLYNGQLDIILAYPLTVNFARKLKWCGSANFLIADRQKWMIDREIAGYIMTSAPSRCNGSLSLVLVRNAGHFVPIDQPIWAYNLISNFTSQRTK